MDTINNKYFLDNIGFRILTIMAVSLFVSELGDISGLAHRLHTVEFYYEFGVTMLIAFIVTELVYRINRLLNRKYPIHEAKLQRAVLQFTGGIMLPALLVFAMASLYFYLNDIDIFRTDYLVFAFPFVIILLIVLNLLLILIPYFLYAYRLQKVKNLDKGSVNANPEREFKLEIPIKVFDGASIILLDQVQIIHAYIINGKVIIQNDLGSELLTDHTLDELEQILDQNRFFRINRQLISAKTACKGFTNLDFGKLKAVLNPSSPVDSIISQIKSKKFKEWLQL